MNRSYQVFIALRYLKSRKRHRSLSFNTAISTGGVALGVMALLIVLAVMSGFHEDLQKKILGVNAHVVVLSYDGAVEKHQEVIEALGKDPSVQSASPFVLGQVMIAKEDRAQGVYLRGIEPALEAKTTELDKYMRQGALKDLSLPVSAGMQSPPGLILGKELASALGIRKGDEVRIMSPTGGLGPLGTLPRIKKFVVSGIFEVGMFEYDSNLVLTAMGPAQEFLGMGNAVSGIELRVDDLYRAKEIAKNIEGRLGFPYYTRDWIEMNKNLFAALKLEKLAMFVILTLIVLVAAFNIVSTLSMNVIEKEPEIAILKAMGASNGGIMEIFMLQGLLVGLVGTAIGLAGGWFTSYMIDAYQIIKLPGDVYYLSHLPAKTNLSDFILVSASAVAISFLATIYPAWQAARLNPIEPLRYE